MRTPIIAVTGIAVVLWATAGLWFAPGFLGSPGGEVWGHAWVQWWHAAALPGWPGGTDLVIGGEPWPVIDPLPTAFSAVLGRMMGAEVGYNAWVVFSIALAFVGGAIAARRYDGDPLVGGLVLACAPAFIGSLSSGLTEDGAVGLAAIGLSGIGRGGRGTVLSTGLCLGLLPWCGPVLAWGVGLAAIFLGAVAIWRDRDCWRAVMGCGALALLLTCPVLWLHADRLMGEGHHIGSVAAGTERLWRLNPVFGADLLSLVTPGPADPGGALVRTHPGYLGLGVLLLALCCGWNRWWWVAGLGIALAPGAVLRFAGESTGISNPAVSLATWLPFGELHNHYGRMLILAAVGLGVLAARGARRLGPWAVVLVVLDLGLLAPLPYPLATADARPDAVMRQLHTLPDGPVLPIPIAGPGVHPQRALADQIHHGRPLLIAPNHPGLHGPVRRAPAGPWLAGLAMPNGPMAPSELGPLPGVSLLLVNEPYVGVIEAIAGSPDLRGVYRSVWVIEQEGK